MSYTAVDLPWGFRPDGKTIFYDKKNKVNFYKGSQLPDRLLHFKALDFSYERWLEDDKNGKPTPPLISKNTFTPRKHQLQGAAKIRQSFRNDWRGFLLADKTGVGKTLTGLAGIASIAKEQGFTPKNKAKLLIVCPKSVKPQWRNTIHSFPVSSSLMRIMIINYEQLKKLLDPPKEARKAKKTKTKNKLIASKGTPKIDWDYIIFDEAHYLKNYPSSGTSLAAVSVAQLNKPYIKGKTPFVIFSTATPGATPLNLSVMGGFIAKLLSDKPTAKKVTPDTWGPFLFDEGFAVKKGKVVWSWAPTPWYGKNSDDPKEVAKYERALADNKRKQRRDTQRIGKALTKKEAPFIMRGPKDIAGWPEQQIIPMPMDLTVKQRPLYEEAWSIFRNWLKLNPAKSDPKGALVQQLRYRQKASLLKPEQVVEQIKDWVDNDFQVYVSCEFIETIDKYKELLEASGITVAEISGRTSKEREEERLKFQKGLARVVLCTVVEGISLHQGEELPDGTKATSNPRITVLSDVRQNNLASTQSIGRCHRSGENSLTYIPYFDDTVDERVVMSFVNKQANMSSMLGSTIVEAEELETLFRKAAEDKEASQKSESSRTA